MTFIIVSNTYQETSIKMSVEHETCSQKAQLVVISQHKVVTLKGNVKPD